MAWITWKDRGSCKNKELALALLTEQIEYLYAQKDHLDNSTVLVLRGEMEGFAVEWSIPFCWELHEQLLSRRSDYGYESWENSGCSWDDSGCSY